MTFRVGTATCSAKVPGCFSERSVRFGSRVSSPFQLGSEMTEWTTTSLPSGSVPAASQPRIIGSASSLRPTPRSVHSSWWFSEAALTSTTVQPSVTSGSGCSPSSRPESGASLEKPVAVTANTGRRAYAAASGVRVEPPRVLLALVRVGDLLLGLHLALLGCLRAAAGLLGLARGPLALRLGGLADGVRLLAVASGGDAL